MEDKPNQSLESRVEALEKGLLRIEYALERRERADQEAARMRLDALSARKGVIGRVKGENRIFSLATSLLHRLRNTEGWIGKIGIGLLLFGLIFLFKYAVDQGWLTPDIRVLFGLGLGLVLLFLSYRLYEKRRHFSLLLFGGAIVSFYVTGFAAFQLFDLVAYGPALAFMVFVTTLSFLVSVRQKEAMPALLGAVGGFLTPFLLYVEPISVPGLVGYACVLIAGALLVYYYRGWRPLLWLTFVGGGIVLAIPLITEFVDTTDPSVADRLPMQAGLIVAWLLFATVPIAREVMAARPTSTIPRTVPGVRLIDVSDPITRYLRQHLTLFSPIVALLALALSTPIYPLEENTWGWVVLGLSLLYGATAYNMVRRDSLKEYATSHGATALIFFTISMALLFDGHERMLVIGFEAMMLLVLSNRFKNAPLQIAGHILFFILMFSMLDRLFATDLRNRVILNPRGIVDLILFAFALYGSWRLPSVRQRSIYRLLVHLALLIWFVRELDSLDYGQGIITICWGVYAVSLVVVGLLRDYPFVRTLGVGTLLLVVGKLFLVDLATLETTWRILLFLGFGGVFLLLSYFFKTLWHKEES